MRRLILANPSAARLGEPDALRSAIAGLPETELRFTERPGQATELSREACEEGVEEVVVAGGDGSLNEAVHGLIEADRGEPAPVRLGILPLGTGNDLARSLGIPGRLEGAVAALRAGQVRSMDVGRIELPCGAGRSRRLFVNMATGGFPSEVSEAVDAATKRSWGPLAYLSAALEVAEELAGFGCRLEPESGEPLELAVFRVSVANGRTVAGGVPAAPHARLDDGRLDVVVIPAQPMARLTLLLAQIAAGRHLEGEGVVSLRTDRLRLDSHPSMRLHLDGEDAGDGPVRFDVLPGALEVIVGPHPAKGVFAG